MSKFDELFAVNVNSKVEERTDGRTTLKYLSWSWAWSEFMKYHPDATYEIVKFPNEQGMLLPYMHDEMTGYMVNTKVTADGVTHEMWLPVMNSSNKAMKCMPYEYETRAGKRTVEQASMFDINKTIMRCLTKNLAMFGLGLYIYSGEDLPEQEKEEQVVAQNADLAEQIKSCTDESALGVIYQSNKAKICANPTLLDMITTKGRELRKAS